MVKLLKLKNPITGQGYNIIFIIVNKFTKQGYFIIYYYRPYKQDSTSTQRGFGKVSNQYTGYRTDGASKTIRRGVAKSYS